MDPNDPNNPNNPSSPGDNEPDYSALIGAELELDTPQEDFAEDLLEDSLEPPEAVDPLEFDGALELGEMEGLDGLEPDAAEPPARAEEGPGWSLDLAFDPTPDQNDNLNKRSAADASLSRGPKRPAPRTLASPVLSVPQPVEAPTLETRFAERVDQLPVLTRLAVLWATILLMLGFATFAIVAGTAAFQRSAEQRMQELMQAQPPQGASGTRIPPEFEALRQGRRPQHGGK